MESIQQRRNSFSTPKADDRRTEAGQSGTMPEPADIALTISPRPQAGAVEPGNGPTAALSAWSPEGEAHEAPHFGQGYVQLSELWPQMESDQDPGDAPVTIHAQEGGSWLHAPAPMLAALSSYLALEDLETIATAHTDEEVFTLFNHLPGMQRFLIAHHELDKAEAAIDGFSGSEAKRYRAYALSVPELAREVQGMANFPWRAPDGIRQTMYDLKKQQVKSFVAHTALRLTSLGLLGGTVPVGLEMQKAAAQESWRSTSTSDVLYIVPAFMGVVGLTMMGVACCFRDSGWAKQKLLKTAAGSVVTMHLGALREERDQALEALHATRSPSEGQMDEAAAVADAQASSSVASSSALPPGVEPLDGEGDAPASRSSTSSNPAPGQS